MATEPILVTLDEPRALPGIERYPRHSFIKHVASRVGQGFIAEPFTHQHVSEA
jgi:hypothetical protein